MSSDSVFNETSGELYQALKDLIYGMMLNENDKLSIENDYSFSVLNNNHASIYSTKEAMESGLLADDKKGFVLSLKLQELLFKNGYRHIGYKVGPDVVETWAENMLYKHGLSYPKSWVVISDDRDGLHFKHNDSSKIESDHERFMDAVKKLKLSDFEKKRIVAICEYYKASRLLLSKYMNEENLDIKTTTNIK